MQQIVPPVSIVQKILGEQKKIEGTSYRMTVHCVRAERPEGVLLCHTLTGELLLLSREEEAALKMLPGPVPPALEALASRWFLRPEGSDDMALADQTRRIAERFRKKDGLLTKYTIFTTMACNARCFYCFEAGWGKSSTMSEETARATAAYIGAHRGGQPVKLRWFGGEPLVNAKAIDVITDSLRKQGVEFRSVMTTNGYLFDEALVRRAKDDWNLQQTQITLDGTEEIYNARKAYVHPEGSPFRRVLGNIGLLLDAGIGVDVRLNMDEDNEGDLYALADQLAERFAGKRGFGVHLLAIQKNHDGVDPLDCEKERRVYVEKLRPLRDYMEEKHIAARLPLSRGLSIDACRADSDSATTVTPDGRLGRCDSSKDGGIWGSVWSEERNEEVLRQWKERRPPEAACKSCAIYPQCIRLKKCPTYEHGSALDQEVREVLEDRLRRAVLGAFEDWKAANKA